MTTFSQLIDQILARKVSFLVSFFIIFTFSYAVLFVFDFLPETPSSTSEQQVESFETVLESQGIDALDSNTTSTIEQGDVNIINSPVSMSVNNTVDPVGTATNTNVADDSMLPTTLKIPSLNRVVTILNPTSRSIANLDVALLKGVVRHPDSAVLGQEGNLFILGHSSYLPKVFNKNFQALNGIQNLKWGDIVTLQSKDTIYTYQVKKVYQAKAENITVPIAGAGKHLTLATCNSFGSKDDRYMVEADLISTATL